MNVLASGPVIPNYGTAHGCIGNNDSMFCTTWIRQHWTDTLQPALIQHLWLTGIAVGIGFAIAFACALAAHRLPFFAAGHRVEGAIDEERDHREHKGDRDPHGAVRPDPREPLEDRIQPAGAVVNDPPLEVSVEAQTGRSCLVEAVALTESSR